MKLLHDISVSKRLWVFTMSALLVLMVAGGASQRLAQQAQGTALDNVQ